MLRLSSLTLSMLIAYGLLFTGPTTSPVLAAPRHQGTQASQEWQSIGLHTPVWRIFTPSSGALLARTPESLVRAAGGDPWPWSPNHWQALPVPAHTTDARYWNVVVDPTDHDTLYASATGGLYKSTDAGRTWAPLLATADHAQTIAVSPANHDVLYAGLGKYGDGGMFRFLRSRDGGASWHGLDEHQNMTCSWAVPILQPHATDENRVFRAGGCYAGRDFYDQLTQSTDQGTSWTAIFGVGVKGVSSRDSQHPQFTFPTWMAGGQSVNPARFYLATRRDSRVGVGASLFRSDDDAQTWTEVYASRTATEPDELTISVVGLTYDPAQPDTVYVGLNVYARPVGGSPAQLVRAGVQVSADGGVTWHDLGRQNLAKINDLVLGVDGENLFVATNSGLLRLALE